MKDNVTTAFLYGLIAIAITFGSFQLKTVYDGNLRSAQAKAFNEGRLRQCTYTWGCDMKALKSELFDQQRKIEKKVDKPTTLSGN